MINNLFRVKDRKICFNTYKVVIRHYTLDMDKYKDSVQYVDDEGLYELEVNYIPKHRLFELVSKELLDTSEYSWMEGIELRTTDMAKEISEIVSYGSLEAYKASLSENTDLTMLDMDYRLSKLELGI